MGGFMGAGNALVELARGRHVGRIEVILKALTYLTLQ